MKIFPLIILILWVWEGMGKKFNCVFHQYAHSNHYKTKPQDAVQYLTSGLHNKQHGRLLQGGKQQMRITLDNSDFNTIKTTAHGQAQTTAANLAFIFRAMSVAKTFYQSRLKVAQQSSITLPSNCLDFAPADGNTQIANTDLHIYVRYTTDNTLGYGATGISCQWNSIPANIATIPDTQYRSGRPKVGRIIFNTFNIIDSKGTHTNRLFAAITATSLHETMHILGFDRSLYSSYLSSSGTTYSSGVITSTSRALNVNRKKNFLMTTPNVLAWTKNFFNCSSIDGMPLQNEESASQGDTPGSHWERLAMYDELMTGTDLGPQKSITALTFALLKDMGWYDVDDTFNDTTNYGYKLGCSFFNDACNSTENFSKYFCNPASYVNVSECSTTFTGKAVCSSIPGLMADGCGIFAEYFACVDPDSVGDFYKLYTLQTFATNSFCIKGTFATSGIQSTYRSRCYPFACNYNNTSIAFTIGTNTVTCLNFQQGSTKTVGGQGNIQCPNFNDFCVQSRKICPNWCSKNGVCTRGICNCYSNSTVTYSGADCSISTCAPGNFFDSVTNSCSLACSSHYYANDESRACLICSSNCQECRDQATICISCQASTPTNPKYLNQIDGSCVSNCPNGTYQYSSNSTCVLCNVLCKTCSGNSNYCTSCSDPTHFLNQNGNCGPDCNVASYTLKDEVYMMCRQTCPQDLFTNGSKCNRCDNTSYKQLDSALSICSSNCSANNYKDEVLRVCGPCQSTCLTCSGKYAENCTSCSTTGIYKYLHLSMCFNICPYGFFPNDNTGKCEICTVGLGLNCATCTYNGTPPAVRCLTCLYGFYLQPNNTCLPSCDPGKFANKWNQTCLDCDSSCQTCYGPDSANCITCSVSDKYLKNSTGGYCLTSCPTIGYVTSTSCIPCHQTCATCNNNTSSGCITCASGLYLENHQCRYVCSPQAYPNKTTLQCLPCNSLCSFCFGATVDNCTLCTTGYVLSNFTCTTKCPQGQTANNFSVCQASSYSTILTSFLAILVTIYMLI